MVSLSLIASWCFYRTYLNHFECLVSSFRVENQPLVYQALVPSEVIFPLHFLGCSITVVLNSKQILEVLPLLILLEMILNVVEVVILLKMVTFIER